MASFEHDDPLPVQDACHDGRSPSPTPPAKARQSTEDLLHREDAAGAEDEAGAEALTSGAGRHPAARSSPDGLRAAPSCAGACRRQIASRPQPSRLGRWRSIFTGVWALSTNRPHGRARLVRGRPGARHARGVPLRALQDGDLLGALCSARRLAWALLSRRCPSRWPSHLARHRRGGFVRRPVAVLAARRLGLRRGRPAQLCKHDSLRDTSRQRRRS